MLQKHPDDPPQASSLKMVLMKTVKVHHRLARRVRPAPEWKNRGSASASGERPGDQDPQEVLHHAIVSGGRGKDKSDRNRRDGPLHGSQAQPRVIVRHTTPQNRSSHARSTTGGVSGILWYAFDSSYRSVYTIVKDYMLLFGFIS